MGLQITYTVSLAIRHKLGEVLLPDAFTYLTECISDELLHFHPMGKVAAHVTPSLLHFVAGQMCEAGPRGEASPVCMNFQVWRKNYGFGITMHMRE